MEQTVERTNIINQKDNRIEWVDIYKGIAILLMVMGHTTGQFNNYIYQFHMAAFFFISGYTKKSNKGIITTIWEKTYTLLVPYISIFFLLLFADGLLNYFSVRNLFFSSDMIYVGIFESCKELLLHGNCYVWLLGAGWFILVLFAIEVIHACVLKLCKHSIGVYSIVIFILYFIGYKCAIGGQQLAIGPFDNDLAFIGLLFFGAGFIVGQSGILDKKFFTKSFHLVLLPIIMFTLWYFGNVRPVTVNYPTRSFNYPFIEFFLGINGVALIYILSKLLVKIAGVKKIFIYVGRNTLGILFFHFVFFKLAYYILYIINIVPIEYMSNFVPTEDVAKYWWPLIALVSIVCSLMVWHILTRVKGLRWFFGIERKKWNILLEKARNKVKPEKLTRLLFCGSKENKYSWKSTPFLWVCICTVIAVVVPLLNQGIMCNDEIQYYFWTRQGFEIAYNHFREMWIVQGRFLSSIFTPIWMSLSVLGESMYIFRIIPVLSILLNIILFSIFIYKIFDNKWFSIFCGVCLCIYLPISFAPMAPNAYTTTFGIPFSFLLIALILYANYFKSYNKKILVPVSLFMLIAFSSYEVFVTYVPLFCIIAIAKIDKKNVISIIKASVVPIMTGILYLILYLGSRIIMPSSYEGNSIGFTIHGALEILLYLFKMSFPGSFLNDPTHQYLNEIYTKVDLADWFRISVVFGGSFYIVWYLIKKQKAQSEDRKMGWTQIIVVGVAMIYAILPALPLAISSMYQNNIGSDKGFIALPTTYFTFFASTFLCCYIIWEIFRKGKREFNIFILFMTLLLCVPIQYMNSNFSAIQYENYSVINDIEDFLCTDYIKGKNAIDIYSEDIFQTRISLGIHDSYWQDIINIKGGQAKIYHGQPNNINEETFILSYQNGNFVLEGYNTVLVASKDYIQDINIEVSNGLVMKAELNYVVYEDGYYFYDVINK